MIQDLGQAVFKNEYEVKKPMADSTVFIFSQRKVLIRKQGEEICFPSYQLLRNQDIELVYLFTINEEAFYLADDEERVELADFEWENINLFRVLKPKVLAFAGITAYHLSIWYKSNRFCGCCGSLMNHSGKERAVVCPNCQHVVYPRISPAIIVGVTDGNRILMTKYAGRDYKKYALVAGFCEIGETAEKTVEREVMEEVGLKVKNIRYYKSQPWGFSGDLLLGFFAEVDGSTDITRDEDELAEAVWIERECIQEENDGVSLTAEMIQSFKEGKY